MATTLQPRADRLLVEPIEEERVTASGLILPDQAREKPQRGRIIALGPELHQAVLDWGQQLDADKVPKKPRAGRLDRPLGLGDEVLYSKYGGTDLKVDGEEVILLRETDVFCRIIEDDDGGKVETLRDAAQP